MRLLGINDNINFPTFTSSDINEEELKEEDKINLQWAMILNKKDSTYNKMPSGQDVIQLKNLVFMFFSDLFKMLYSMPTPIRIVARLFYNELMKKYNRRKACLNVVGNFLIGNWILSALKIN